MIAEIYGPIAQLGERLLRKQEAGGSTPPRSTFLAELKMWMTRFPSIQKNLGATLDSVVSSFNRKTAKSKKFMHRFLSQNTNLNTKSITITDFKEIHHLSTVLRLKKGSEISIFNGQGEEVLAKVENLTAQSVQLTILSPVKKSSGNTITVTLACAIPKKAKFETIIEKCTELGVDRIIPVMTQRTEVRLSEERGDKKQKRYETVAINAAKQSQRSILPVVDVPTAFNDVLKQLTATDAAFIPCLNGERKNILDAFKLKPGQTNTIFFIGPEGDFTDQELQDALVAGCIPVTLGPHVLKVDTAAICAVAAAKLLIERTAQ